jgi:hypothetical protein
MVLSLDVAEHSGRGLRGGSGQGSEGRGFLQDTAAGGATGDGGPLAQGALAEVCSTRDTSQGVLANFGKYEGAMAFLSG